MKTKFTHLPIVLEFHIKVKENVDIPQDDRSLAFKIII